MSKFKKGDIVKGRGGPNGFGVHGWEHKVGQLATIIHVTVSSYHVKWHDGSINGTVFSHCRFEFVSSGEDASVEKESEEEMTDEQLADVYRKSMAIAKRVYDELLSRDFVIIGTSVVPKNDIRITKVITSKITL